MTQHMTSLPAEQWRPVPSYPEFEASSWGRVRKRVATRVMHHGGVRTYGGMPRYGVLRKSDGYLVANAASGAQVRVHRLVCEAFHGAMPADKPFVMHADDDPKNNRPENLSWGSHQDNMSAPGMVAKIRKAWQDGKYHGRNTKLLPKDVEEIRNRLSEGATHKSIAADYGVARNTITMIAIGRHWAAI